MKQTFIFFALFLVTVRTYAQTPEWQWAVQGGGDSVDKVMRIEQMHPDAMVLFTYCGDAKFGSIVAEWNTSSRYVLTVLDFNGNWIEVKRTNIPTLINENIVTYAGTGIHAVGNFSGKTQLESQVKVSRGGTDFFISARDYKSNLLWFKSAGGDRDDTCDQLYVDNSGNCYVAGSFNSTKVSFTWDIELYACGYWDFYVAKINSQGIWQWAKSICGKDIMGIAGMDVDKYGNVYLTGGFSKSAFGSDLKAIESKGFYDIYVLKLNSNGNMCWAASAGGENSDSGEAITVDKDGNSYILGKFTSEDTKFGNTHLQGIMFNDKYFIAKIDSNGKWLWSMLACDEGNITGIDIAVDDEYNIYITGNFEGAVKFGSHTLNSLNQSSDIFVAKLKQN